VEDRSSFQLAAEKWPDVGLCPRDGSIPHAVNRTQYSGRLGRALAWSTPGHPAVETLKGLAQEQYRRMKQNLERGKPGCFPEMLSQSRRIQTIAEARQCDIASTRLDQSQKQSFSVATYPAPRYGQEAGTAKNGSIKKDTKHWVSTSL
jgi:hypothetical protein